MFFAALVACCAFCSAATKAQVVDLRAAPLQTMGRSLTAAMIFDTGGSITTLEACREHSGVLQHDKPISDSFGIPLIFTTEQNLS
jgi:hypothetical protein